MLELYFSYLACITQAEGTIAFAEAVDRVCPGLLHQKHPILLFKLRAAHFSKLARDGHVQEALEVARQQLTPLADQYPHLQQQLKVRSRF